MKRLKLAYWYNKVFRKVDLDEMKIYKYKFLSQNHYTKDYDLLFTEDLEFKEDLDEPIGFDNLYNGILHYITSRELADGNTSVFNMRFNLAQAVALDICKGNANFTFRELIVPWEEVIVNVKEAMTPKGYLSVIDSLEISYDGFVITMFMPLFAPFSDNDEMKEFAYLYSGVSEEKVILRIEKL